MIETPLCVDCICLSICLSKDSLVLIHDCSLIKNKLKEITITLGVDDEQSIFFYGINKEYFINKTHKQALKIIIRTDHSSCHICDFI